MSRPLFSKTKIKSAFDTKRDMIPSAYTTRHGAQVLENHKTPINPTHATEAAPSRCQAHLGNEKDFSVNPYARSRPDKQISWERQEASCFILTAWWLRKKHAAFTKSAREEEEEEEKKTRPAHHHSQRFKYRGKTILFLSAMASGVNISSDFSVFVLKHL